MQHNTILRTLDIDGLAHHLDTLPDLINESRLAVLRAAHEAKRLEVDLADAQRDFKLRWKADDEVDRTDPTTGRTNIGHTDDLFEAAFQDRYGPAIQAVTDAQEERDRLQAEVDALQTQFTATRYKARLASSALAFMASGHELDAALGNGRQSEREPEPEPPPF